MSVLLWIAVIIGVWCVASVVTALCLGTWLRRRRRATDPQGALRPLDTGPLRLWLGEFPEVPDTPAPLEGLRRTAAEAGSEPELPAPRESADAARATR